MKILLIRHDDSEHENTRLPKSLNKKQGYLPPIGLSYICAALERAGHDVKLLDAQALRLSDDEIREHIRKFNPRLVGLSTMTPAFRSAIKTARLVKQEGVEVMMGGCHLSLFPEQTLSFDEVDYGVLGEGEETVVELCAALEEGRPVGSIDGTASKQDGEIKVNRPMIVEDLDKLPIPSYHQLPMDDYSSIIGLHPVSTIMGSRGCPYRCSFCFKGPPDARYRKRRPEDIVDEMELLIKKYKVKEIMFYDDMMPKGHVAEICEDMLRRDLRIQWESPQRVNMVTPELLKLMKRAGCRMLRFGVEQGDPYMMTQVINKKIDIELTRNAFRWTHEAGIETFAYFIIGYLGETPETMEKTIKLAIELNPRYVMFTKAVPLPGTQLHEEAIKGGFIAADYWEKFILGQKTTPISDFVPDADKWVERAYRKFYFRPKFIARQLMNIRSMKDLRKNVDGFMGILNFRQS